MVTEVCEYNITSRIHFKFIAFACYHYKASTARVTNWRLQRYFYKLQNKHNKTLRSHRSWVTLGKWCYSVILWEERGSFCSLIWTQNLMQVCLGRRVYSQIWNDSLIPATFSITDIQQIQVLLRPGNILVHNIVTDVVIAYACGLYCCQYMVVLELKKYARKLSHSLIEHTNAKSIVETISLLLWCIMGSVLDNQSPLPTFFSHRHHLRMKLPTIMLTSFKYLPSVTPFTNMD